MAARVRAAAAAALLFSCGAAWAAADPDPESQLLEAIGQVEAGQIDVALAELDRLLTLQPNFRLARLYRAELQAASAGHATPDLAAGDDPEIRGLAEEARLRLQHWRQGVADNTAPTAILQLPREHPYAVAVDLSRSRLYLLESKAGEVQLRRSFYASIGKGGWGKQTAGDNRTPVGIYAITGFIADKTLPELYGAGAFPMDYPNAWDERRRLTGSGIWLHGVPRDTYVRAPRSSEGCVTLANADLLALKPYLEAGHTPVILSDRLDWEPRKTVWERRAEFLEQVEGWRARWAARDTEGYLAYYADDFEVEGMNKAAFAAHKRRVNSGKSKIDVQLDDVQLFRYPGNDGLWLARFTQHYRSSDSFSRSTRKEQFWRIAGGRWRIVKETSR